MNNKEKIELQKNKEDNILSNAMGVVLDLENIAKKISKREYIRIKEEIKEIDKNSKEYFAKKTIIDFYEAKKEQKMSNEDRRKLAAKTMFNVTNFINEIEYISNKLSEEKYKNMKKELELLDKESKKYYFVSEIIRLYELKQKNKKEIKNNEQQKINNIYLIIVYFIFFVILISFFINLN